MLRGFALILCFL